MLLRKFFVVVLLSFLSLSAFAASKNDQNNTKLKVYLTGSLFNERETLFNLELAKALEKKGYDVILPQRDGFVWKDLIKQIDNKIPKRKAYAAGVNAIYLLNMGKFIPQSDVVVAVLDEPTDEGVVVELTYAHMIGKPVIGLRTDLRNKYNEEIKLFSGVHSFVAYQCDSIIDQPHAIRNDQDAKDAMNVLTSSIAEKVKNIKPAKTEELPAYATSNPEVSKLIDGANILFAGVNDIHSNDGVDKVVKRFFENEAKLTSLKIGLRFG